MVSGRRPYVADGIADLALKIVMEPIPRLGDGPSPLDDVIAGCLAREPAQRFPNVAALAGALAPFAGELAAASPLIAGADLPARAPPGRQSAVHALGPRDPAIFEPGTTVQSSGAIESSLPARTTRSRLGVLGVLVAAAAVGTLLAVAVTREDRASSPPAAQPRPAPAEFAAPAHVAPAGSATAPAAPRGAPPPPMRAAEATPPGLADAGVVEPVASPAAAAAAPGANPPVAAPGPGEPPPRRTPARPKPHAPKPSTAELSKSRI
jgi:serine/threonine-protein kinase